MQVFSHTHLSSKGSSLAEPEVKPSSSLPTFNGVLSLFDKYASESDKYASFLQTFFFDEKKPIKSTKAAGRVSGNFITLLSAQFCA